MSTAEPRLDWCTESHDIENEYKADTKSSNPNLKDSSDTIRTTLSSKITMIRRYNRSVWAALTCYNSVRVIKTISLPSHCKRHWPLSSPRKVF